MKQVTLTQGQVALLDDEDFSLAVKYLWCAWKHGNTFYAKRRDESGKTVLLHREIIGAAKGQEVDHVNGNGLDCRRANLRCAARAENARNRRKHATGQSIYKGVFPSRAPGRWKAKLTVNGATIHLGSFGSQEAAAREYDRAALKLHGEFASLNFSCEISSVAGEQVIGSPKLPARSGYRGVYWSKRGRNWKVQIVHKQKVIHVGCFEDPVEAAKAYDGMARSLHKTKAKLNFG